MNILFVCKHNRFRSKIAEAILKSLKCKNIEVKSAGLRKDLIRPYVCENVKIVLKQRGINKIDEAAREINDVDLRWADRIIIVADNVSADIFPKEKTEIWKIGDADESEIEKIKMIAGDIERKVKELVKRVNI